MTLVPGRAHGVTRSLASATMARNSLLGLKTGTGRAATSTGSPVRGLRAMRVLRWRILDRKSTRLNSSHSQISYAVFCLKKKKVSAILTPLTTDRQVLLSAVPGDDDARDADS